MNKCDTLQRKSLSRTLCRNKAKTMNPRKECHTNTHLSNPQVTFNINDRLNIYIKHHILLIISRNNLIEIH